jgi:predicted permease
LVPVGGGSANGGSFFVESRPRDEGELPPVAMYKAIGADYLTTIRQPVVEGRDLTRADWQGGPPVAIVNQTFARRFLDDRALGEGIKWDEEAQFARIVGVVADAKEMGLVDDFGAWAYLPLVVGDWGYPVMDGMSLVIRSAAGQAAPVQTVREVVTRLDPSVPITNVRTMDEALARDMARTSFTMLILGVAATVALTLGAVGLFGVVSYVVGRRTREIGVRVAVGARAEDIRAMVLGQGLRVSAAGVAIGLAAAFGLTRLMGAVLYEVRATDPVTFVLGPVVLVAVALLATWLPARRASRVDPVVALRNE